MKNNYRGKFCNLRLVKKHPRESHYYNIIHVLQKSVEELLVLLAPFFPNSC